MNYKNGNSLWEGGVLNQVLYGEAPPKGPTPLCTPSVIYHF